MYCPNCEEDVSDVSIVFGNVVGKRLEVDNADVCTKDKGAIGPIFISATVCMACLSVITGEIKERK